MNKLLQITVNAEGQVTAASTDTVPVVKTDGSQPYTGNQDMGGHKIVDAADPTAAQDYATKAYVDAHSGGTPSTTSVYRSSSLTLTSGTEAPVDWSAAAYDTEGMWASSPNPTRLTAVSSGKFFLNAQVQLGTGFAGTIHLRFYKNGSLVAGATGPGSGLTSGTERHEAQWLADLNAGDYVEVKAMVELIGGGTIALVGGATTLFLQCLKAQASGGSVPTTSAKGDVLASNGSAFAIEGVGSDGTVLTADSTQALGVKWATPPAGALVLLEEHAASSSAELDFTSWYLTSYDEYVIEIVNLVPATDGVTLLWEASTNGGSTYDTGSNYQWAGFRSSKAGSASAGATATTSIDLSASGTQKNTASLGGVVGTARLFQPGNTTFHKRIRAEMGTNDGSTNPDVVTMLSGAYTVTGSAVNAFRVRFSSGNIASGTVRVYGVAK